MISAWDIYWVMQFDSIRGVCSPVAFLGCGFGVVGTGICSLAAADGEDWAPPMVRLGKKVVAAGLIAALACAFIPSTKTAAAMVVLPAIANNEAIQREAGDLYGIAKDALRNLAAPKQEAHK